MSDSDKAIAGRAAVSLHAVWMDGYDEGRRHGVAVMVRTIEAVVSANNGAGLSSEALRAVLAAVQREVGLPTAPARLPTRKDCFCGARNEPHPTGETPCLYVRPQDREAE